MASHNRALWERAQEERGWTDMDRRDIPGFFDCLQEMHDGGYSFTDIGAVFGLTGERIRQYFDGAHQLTRTHTGAKLRYWCDVEERFVCRDPEDIAQEASGRYQNAVRLQWTRRQRRRMNALAPRIASLAEELGRQPTIRETAQLALGEVELHQASPRLYGWITGRDSRQGGGGGFIETMDTLYAMAGIERRKMTGKTGGGVVRKLTAEQVRDIRGLHVCFGLSQTALAQRYDVSSGTIRKIVNGETYKDVL